MEGAPVKEWLTARELAAEALPDMPATHSAVLRLAARLGWDESLAYVRPRAGRGGGLEYHINLLPPVARLEYERRHRQIVRPEPQARPAIVLGEGLTDRAARERDARLAIVAAFEAFSQGQRLGDAARSQIFVDRYNLGAIAVDPWIRETVRSLSKRTLARWRSAKFLGRLDRLAVDRAAARKGKGVLDTAAGGRVRTFVLALIAHQPLLTAAQVRVQCLAEFGFETTLPPVRTFQHWLKTLKAAEQVLLTRLSDPNRYRSNMVPSGTGTYRWVQEPNALWMIDASPVDALCIDGRHTIYACIDIATRRTVFYVSRTPRAAAVGMLMRKAILAWGVPQKVKTDNGSDFVANETKRLMASLGIEMELSDSYSPQQKAHVESVIKTFQHGCAALLPGFVGHSVADRKRLEDRKTFAQRLGEETAETFGVSLTGEGLQRIVDQWAETIYARTPHSGLKGATPADTAAGSAASIRTVDERALDILVMPVADGGIRKVTRLGIRVDHRHYQIGEADVGQRVLVRMDPMDAGRVLAFDADDGRFVGIGRCAELSGLHPATLIKARRELVNDRYRAASKQVREEIKRLVRGPSMIEKALEVAAQNEPNVVALPKREERHETPAIAAALEASARPTSAPRAMDARTAALHAELTAAPIAVEAGDKVRPLRRQETSHQRFRRAQALEARRAAGEALSEDEAFWLGGYSAGPEYRAMRAVYEDAGGEQLR
ncbi:Mu transposase C-terminal domain-containing protein [Prosthecomicrobium hirschii]|uniref:Mu transposase C-terminal domain-containing protein n=1 Tax=Prosthecodimorpha hirschii TaxID=665126 RepID=UPI00221F87B4|nr:Mu transposase C-terminal domain-containing protein [Prosthecomicrobium hirschii]MCW1842267.1 DDE-type integrase/transposase/recombinase [Prosthecomicrobium hirschii]